MHKRLRLLCIPSCQTLGVMTKEFTEDPEYLSSCTLMVIGQKLVPRSVTQLLRLRPSNSWQKGDPNSLGTNTRVSGGWKRALPQSLEAKELHVQLGYWCRLLEGRKQAIRTLAKREELCALDCLAISENTVSIILLPSLQLAVAKLGLEFRLSFWAHSEGGRRDA
jgi:Domain of unknown function (DUF4279)